MINVKLATENALKASLKKLHEADDNNITSSPSSVKRKSPSEGSLDAQVDKYLTQFEKTCKNDGEINVEEFAVKIVRMIENYDNLLDVKNALIVRATSFLKEAYDDEIIYKFVSTLKQEHGLEAGKTDTEIDDDRYVAPPGDHAGPSLASA